ncbi:hypothetical protein P8452_62252 [Trifolium repens]|nr:hypothetical protein P8452_62252 [Trifolium repens]
MEGGGSLRIDSSSIWRNNDADEIFSNSFHQEDDEEALKWAAIQKLPTFARLRKGLLTSLQGEATEIDIEKLGLQERKDLLERLVRLAEEDNEKFLLKLKDRIDRVGIDLPTIEVRFEHLNIEAEAHVGSRSLPTFTNFMVNIVEGLLNSLHVLPSRKQHLNILKDVSGIIKPSRMALLLGPPSSGKTTLLLALAGKLDPKLKFSGKVTYNGHEMNEFVPQRTSAYVDQHDLHIGEMTVRETLAFSARVQGVGPRYDLLAELSRREKHANIVPDPDIDVYMKAIATEGQKANLITDYVLRVLGLEICADTVVGNAMLRGISGGQRKRVTTGEMLVGPKGVADFLQEVTSRKDQEQYWEHKDQPYRFVTAEEFSDAFQSFHVGIRLGDELGTEFDKSKSHPSALTTKKYGVGRWELYKALLSREYLLMKRNSFVYIFKLCQLSIMAMIAMTIFFRTEMHRDSVTHGGIYVVAAWVFLTYYVIGFDPYIGRFFRQYLILVLVHQMASSLFRFIAAIGRDLTVALTFGSFVLAILVAMSGFVLSKDSIKKGWIWGFWISPMMYAQNAMVNNEFLGNKWKHVLPNSTETLGVDVLKSRGYFTESYWYWIGVGALIGYTLVFNFGYILALTFLNPLAKHQTAIPEESQNNEQNGGTRKRTNVLKFIKDSFSQHSNRVRKGESTSGSVSPSTLSSRQETIAAETNHSRKRGMVLPFEPHSITFDEVTYSVVMPQEMRNRGVVEDKLVLLKGVSGAFRPGVLTALMGVTGAGKTTLMDVLAAWLRLSPDINAETRKMFIEEVMELVELKPLRNALVGLPGVSGLSTEQRKRLTIAVELVSNPSIIFMDEPTSGLDARAAAIVMRTVRNTVDTGRTVVCTIHQPSIDIFESFDELLLLKQGGQEIYVGPLGHHSSNLISYFEGIQGVSKIKDGYNPATWMLEVTNSSKEVELGVDFAEVYKNSELHRRNKELIKELSTPAPAVLLGTMFWNLGCKIEKEQDLFNAMGSMYAAVLLIGIKNSTSVQPVVSVERTVVIELPYVFVQSLVYGFIVYAMIGFEWNVAKVLWFLFFMIHSPKTEDSSVVEVVQLDKSSGLEFMFNFQRR